MARSTKFFIVAWLVVAAALLFVYLLGHLADRYLPPIELHYTTGPLTPD